MDQNNTATVGALALRKELRLALVCYGGVSLAVYMHGITVELQRLVAASAVFESNAAGPNPFPNDSTERLYWDALHAIWKAGNGLVLRVVVDIISGTSAGGINGVVLAKSLARGLKQDPLREVWFDNASLLKLIAGRFRWWWQEKAPGPWAPLSGLSMSRWAYDALTTMNRQPVDGPAKDLPLVPDGNELDLFITTTDCTGFRRTIDLYDPRAVHDLEYRHILHFNYDPGTADTSSFGAADDRMLTLAVRATSSFPGAFPPVTLEEIGQVAGPFSKEELAAHFTDYFLADAQPDASFFLDGGVLNNRPFDHAVHAIMTRTADREVVRRLLFIEPDPAEISPDRTKKPGWLGTVASAMMGIPQHQPIADALTDLARHNIRAQEIRQLIALTEPHVFNMIGDIADKPNALQRDQMGALQALTLPEIEEWAQVVGDDAQVTFGGSYGAYEAIKVGEVLADISSGICSVFRYPAASRQAAMTYRIIRRWAVGMGYLPDIRGSGAIAFVAVYTEAAGARRGFLRAFDLNFRRRRLRFLIRRINDAYAEFAAAELRLKLDATKQGLYKLIRTLRYIQSGRWALEADHADLRGCLTALFGTDAMATLLAQAAELPLDDTGAASHASANLDDQIDRYLKQHDQAITQAFELLENAVNAHLNRFWHDQSQALKWLLDDSGLPRELLQQLLLRYVGYALWDTILYPLIALSGITEPDPVEVIRISPNDTKLLQPLGAAQRLKGISAAHFGAFLSRSYRENDFLWGRLDGVERLLGVLADAGASGAPPDTGLIWRGFKAVLEKELSTMREADARAMASQLMAQVKGAA